MCPGNRQHHHLQNAAGPKHRAEGLGCGHGHNFKLGRHPKQGLVSSMAAGQPWGGCHSKKITHLWASSTHHMPGAELVESQGWAEATQIFPGKVKSPKHSCGAVVPGLGDKAARWRLLRWS
jgi:hypothetical protein